MSDITDQYLLGTKSTPENQYVSLRNALSDVIEFFRANILKYMYSTRFNGGQVRGGASSEVQSTSNVVTPLIRTPDTSRPDKYKRRRKESKTNDK